MRHKRADRPSRYLVASLHYRTRGREKRASEQEKVTAEAGNHSLYRHHTDPSAKNQCDPPKNLLVLCRYPLPSLLSAAPQRYPTWISNYVHGAKKNSKNRAVYIPTNFYSDSVNPIYIVDRSSRYNRQDNEAPSQISTLLTSRSIVVYRKKRRKKDCKLREANLR